MNWSKIRRRALAAGAIAWASAVPLATFTAAGAPSSVVYLLTLAVYAIGSVICHQRPERSFYLWSQQMPVCARCTGIYLGAALTVLLSPVTRRLGNSRGSTGSTNARAAFAVAASPSLATLVYEWTTGVTPANWIRAASGLCLGIGIAALIQREVN